MSEKGPPREPATVRAYDRLGNKITIPKEDLGKLFAMGGRPATRAEQDEHDLRQEYESKSTAQKIAGAATSTFAGPIVSNAAAASGAVAVQPEVEAFQSKMPTGLTLGADRALTRKALDAVGAPGAGQAYAEHQQKLTTAHGGLQTAGELTGFAASALASPTGAARLAPGLGMAAAGGAVERGVAASLAGVAARGALGRAVRTGASIGTRGALEGAVMNTASMASDSVVNDTPITGEKVYAALGHGAFGGAVMGFGLGTTGSLAASGLRGIAKGVAGLARSRAAAVEATEAVAEKEAVAAKPGLPPRERPQLTAGEAPPTVTPHEPVPTPTPSPRPTATAAEAPAARAATKEGGDFLRKAADDLAFDALGTTRKVADKINEEVRGETTAVGNWVNRRIFGGGKGGVAEMAGRSRADEIHPLVNAEKHAIGREIGGEVAKYNVRVSVDEIVRPATEIMDAMSKDPSRIQGVEAFRKRISDLGEAMHNAGQIAPDQTAALADLYKHRAKLERVSHELGRGSAAEESFRQYLRKVDDILVSKMDDAARLAGQDGSRIKHLKREYQLATVAEESAWDGTKRIRGNNIFGLREGVGAMVGLAMGHPVGAIVGALAGKVLRERGAGMGAQILSRMADSGAVARLAQKVDARVAASAKAVLRETNSASPRASATSRARVDSGRVHTPEDTRKAIAKTQAQAQQVVRWTADVQANPRKFLSDLEDSAVEVSRTAGPQASSAYTAAAVRALNYLTAAIPAKERRDPLDPRSVPPLTLDEANRVVEAARYAARPMLVFDDFERGKVTPEGMRAAKELVPELLAKYQMHLLDEVQTHMIRGRSLTQGQRLRVDKILEGGAIRPERIARYQADFMNVPQDEEQGPAPEKAGGGPVNMTVENTGFDAVEARKSA